MTLLHIILFFIIKVMFPIDNDILLWKYRHVHLACKLNAIVASFGQI